MVSTLSGYTVSEKIAETAKSLIYRAYSEELKENVIIKTPSSKYPSSVEIARINREFEMLSDLNVPGAIRAIKRESRGSQIFLIFEETKGTSLDNVLTEHPLPLRTFLKIAIKLAEILGSMHQKSLIHKDIKPKNILYHEETNNITIIDFGLSSFISNENNTGININTLEGTLNFISPEQTGRMNRSIDCRSDLYSLGATLYMSITSKLPFYAEDPMELVHCHIAKTTTPPFEINPKVPSIVSDIIMKLLEKSPDDRYQNASGLKFDLEECERQYLENGTINPFPLGEKDFKTSFQIPQKLYGREMEIQELMNGFDRIASGKKEMTCIVGRSGTGKSALASELYKPVTKKKGNFISGKFDQFKRDIPYNALLQALEKLLQQILTENKERFAFWKKRILKAVGESGQVIIDLLPEVELIIGKQPPVPLLPPNESHNRFIMVFQRFFWSLALKEHPLVVFLDDLQWADMGTLKLIESLIPKSETQYLYLLGAYREEEVSTSHPLIYTLKKIEEEIGEIKKIDIKPLKKHDVNMLVSETLNCTKKQTEPLSSLIYAKTSGNPFFVTHFLNELHEGAHLQIDAEMGQWKWDMKKLKTLPVTDNVLELMIGKINKLSEPTKQSLKNAALIGSHFNLETLALIGGKTLHETAKSLQEAIKENLVHPKSVDEYMDALSAHAMENNISNPKFRFLHDRIQQAAYTLLEDQEKEERHFAIARLLHKSVSQENAEENIFDIVNHYGLGYRLLDNRETELEVARLSLVAAIKAKNSSAYEPAFKYISFGLKLLGNNGWKNSFDLALNLYDEGVETAYLNHDYENVDSMIHEIKLHVSDPLLLVRSTKGKILSLTAQTRLLDAVTLGLECLHQLGVNIPPDASKIKILFTLVKIKASLSRKSYEQLMERPEISDKKTLAALSIIFAIGTPAYMVNQKAFSLLILSMIELTLKHGNSPYAIYSFMSYGHVLCSVFNNVSLGFPFSQFALKLADKRYSKELILYAKTQMAFHIAIRHRKEHVSSSIKALKEISHLNIEAGDYESASISIGAVLVYEFYSGVKLDPLYHETLKALERLKEIRQMRGTTNISIFLRQICRLTDRTTDFNAPGYQNKPDGELFELLKKGNDRSGHCARLMVNGMHEYLFRNEENAHKIFSEGTDMLQNVVGTIHYAKFLMYSSLVNISLTHTHPTQKTYLKSARSSLKELKEYAKHAPANYLHFQQLIEAELASLKREDQKAEGLYDLAIESAGENGFINDEALANERAAIHYLRRGKKKVGRTFLLDSHFCYKRWGALAKVKQLEEEFPEILHVTVPNDTTMGFESSFSSNMGNSIQDSSSENSLNFLSIIKASRSLTQEMDVEKLLVKLIKLLIENAGAQRGLLLRHKDGQLLLEVESSVESEEVRLLRSAPVEGQGNLFPLSIIHYVQRSGKEVILNDTMDKNQFIGDSYFKASQPKSILCMPILHQNRLVGILYLENKLAAGAFPPHLQETLQILASQAAISLENAFLYSNLEQLVNIRTEELASALTTLKVSQEKLVESEKMASLGSLVAGVAHEINTPIGIGVTAASLLDEETKKVCEELNSGTLKKSSLDAYIIRATKTSSLILSNLLRTSRLISSFKQVSADQQSFEKRKFKIGEYINDVISTLSPEINKRSVTVLVNFEKEFIINSYPGAFAQIITNLVMNSLIHAFDESSNGKIHINIKNENGELVIIFSDNGKGISSEDQKKIFEPFFTTKRNEGGTGLGLHILYNLLNHKLGGTITCESETGTGATFIIRVQEVPIPITPS